jgi:hypothetical protein
MIRGKVKWVEGKKLCVDDGDEEQTITCKQETVVSHIKNGDTVECHGAKDACHKVDVCKDSD